jgi:ABC-type sugar transport system ATPase subunit
MSTIDHKGFQFDVSVIKPEDATEALRRAMVYLNQDRKDKAIDLIVEWNIQNNYFLSSKASVSMALEAYDQFLKEKARKNAVLDELAAETEKLGLNDL